MSLRANYNDLLHQRANHLKAAQEAFAADNQSDYKAAMAKVTALNPQLDDLKAMLDEQDRYAKLNAPVLGGGRHDLEEMGKLLRSGEAVRLDAVSLMEQAGLGRRDSTTLATGTLVTPQGAGSMVRDNLEVVSGIVDQVQTINLTGLSSYEEPYLVSDMEAQGGKVTETAGQARTATDPTFAKAKLAPYELTVTSYVDRNLSRLNATDYASKIQSMALRALRRKLSSLIAVGDGGSPTPEFYGITNAKNTAGAAIYDTFSVGAAIGVDTLGDLVAKYGGEDGMGGNARLLLSKNNLAAIGKLRGTNEKRRLFDITPDPGSPSTGKIVDGGTVIPYTLLSALGDNTLAYGDPFNFLLGLYGDYSIRVDESVKAIERMHTILGDVMVGGNLVVHKGFVIATIGG